VGFLSAGLARLAATHAAKITVLHRDGSATRERLRATVSAGSQAGRSGGGGYWPRQRRRALAAHDGVRASEPGCDLRFPMGCCCAQPAGKPRSSEPQIAFREAWARAAFQTFEPVAIVACLTVKAVARHYDPGQHHDNGCQRSKAIDHSHTPPIAGYSKIDIWNLHKSTIARPVGGVVQKIALHNGS
jgi:hypothetical protein